MGQMTTEESLRVIFGLKLKQYRLQNGYSTKELSEKANVSSSYINEIEKGKKYPKADKIMSLANALDVPYDELVSLQLGERLQQLSNLLSNNTLHEMPLNMFGIEVSDLMGLMSDDPARFSALISTFIEIARNYDVQVEQFLFATLRSYQELHNNYFDELEVEAKKLSQEQSWGLDRTVKVAQLEQLLKDRFNYIIDYETLNDYPKLQGFRSIFIPGEPPRFLVNDELMASQKAFVLARELSYAILDLDERALTSSWLDVESFDQILNNFKASYMASAILMPKQGMVTRLKDLFKASEWQPEQFLAIMDHFDATPEMFMHRLTQLLPHELGLEQLFFLRFFKQTGMDDYELTKELHLSRLHNPHSIPNEHYCRRWISITLLQDLERELKVKRYTDPLVGVQRSYYTNTDHEYFCISLARPLSLSEQTNSCVTIGLAMDESFKRRVRFWNDDAVHVREVNESCERCGISDCKVRASQPTVHQHDQKIKARKEALQSLMKSLNADEALIDSVD
ncbi:MAG: helix-turn-helix domain-containing protein [Bacteroidota bacterium]